MGAATHRNNSPATLLAAAAGGSENYSRLLKQERLAKFALEFAHTSKSYRMV